MNPSRVAAVQKPVRAQGIAKSATLHTATATVGGKSESILVNVNGLPLYYFRADTAKKSLVGGELARLWPPLLSAKPTATGIQGALTALKEPNGQQVAFNGHFLYTFVGDAPGARHWPGRVELLRGHPAPQDDQLSQDDTHAPGGDVGWRLWVLRWLPPLRGVTWNVSSNDG